jgi:glycosyltransferase involved in cell wall biosynthesis
LKKIVHIISGLTDGGAEKILYQIANNTDFYHYIFCLKYRGKYFEKIKKNKVKNNKINVYFVNLKLNLRIFKNLSSFFNLIKLINPDILHCWLYHSIFLSFFLLSLKKKILWSIHGSNISLKYLSFSSYLAARISGIFSYFVPNHIVYCSHFSKYYHHKNFYNKKIGKIIFNGYDSKDFFPSNTLRFKFREKHFIDRNEFVITKVARWDKQKNHKTLFKALMLLKKNHQFTLILCGYGINDKNNLLNIYKKKYLAGVKILIFEKYQKLNQLYNGSDVVVLSSVSESFPNVIMESALCGCNIISSQVGDVQKVVAKGNLFPVKNYYLFYEKLNILIKKFENNKLKKNYLGRNKVNSLFNLSKMISNYNKLYSQK